jgi:hypothetical protein
LLYWIPEKHKGDPEPNFDQVKLVVYLAERSSDLMVAGVEYVSASILIWDWTDYHFRCGHS